MQRYGNPIIILLYLTAFCLLFYGYYSFIIPKYAYMGYEWHPNNFKIMEGVFFTFFFSIFLSSRFKRPSDFLNHLLFIFPVLSMLVMYGAASAPREYIYATLFSFSIIMAISLVPIRLKTVRLMYFDTKDLVWLLAFSLGLYIALIISFGGYQFFNINIWRIYEFRRAAAANLPTVFGYLSPLFGKIIIPLLLLISLMHNKRIFALLAIVGGFLLFALTGHKGPLFYPFVSIAIYYLFKQGLGSYFLVVGFCSLLLLSVSGSFLGKPGDIAGTFFLRRTCLTSAKINMFYYDYFKDRSPLFWAESRLTMGLIDYPYTESSTKVIGQYIYMKEVNANTGWLGTGYMQAGFSGMILYAFIIGMLLKIMDMFALNKDAAIVASVAGIPMMFIATSSDIPTVMLTHGLLLLILLLCCFRLPRAI